jgi:hypothetical protein
MKKAVVVGLIAFVGTLAVVIGQRMSTDAMAVVVGIVCGVAASVPTSLLIIFVTGRRWREMRDGESGQQRPPYPPVVVVNPGHTSGGANPYSGAYLPPPAPPAAARRFRMVGEDEDLFEALLETWDGCRAIED